MPPPPTNSTTLRRERVVKIFLSLKKSLDQICDELNRLQSATRHRQSEHRTILNEDKHE